MEAMTDPEADAIDAALYRLAEALEGIEEDATPGLTAHQEGTP